MEFHVFKLGYGGQQRITTEMISDGTKTAGSNYCNFLSIFRAYAPANQPAFGGVSEASLHMPRSYSNTVNFTSDTHA
jgi:hypothetical protein